MPVTLIAAALIGVAFLAKAAWDVWLGVRMRRVGLRANGMVVGHDRVSGEGSETSQSGSALHR